MFDFAVLQSLRRERWNQTQALRLGDPEAAAKFINRVGIVTLFPVSSEIPNLFHAHVGDREAKTDSAWDSPSGHVYSWRWELGRREAAFYTAIVRSRPTWVSWQLLPVVLRLRGELRTPEELYDNGLLSENAYRIAQVLEHSGGELTTGELRRQAGFPTGKTNRAAYLKAVEELDTRLMLAKVFSVDDDDMRHALVTTRYAEYEVAAEQISEQAALATFLETYLPHAVYILPTMLAKHLKIDEAVLRAGLERLTATGHVEPLDVSGQKGTCYVWRNESR
jgi:hypothetical protein